MEDFWNIASKWSSETWMVFIYMVMAIVFFFRWWIRIQNQTDDPEDQVYLLYCAAIWSAFWPICLLKDIIFGGRKR